MLLKKTLAFATKRVNDFGAQYIAYGVFGVINFPFSYFMWTQLAPQAYESLTLRCIATLMCLGLILKNYWPQKIRPYLPLYWFATIFFSISFFGAFMLIKNNFSLSWQISYAQALLLLILLLDWQMFFAILFTGTFFASITYLALNNFSPTETNWYLFTYIFVYVVILGGFFSRNKEILARQKQTEQKLIYQRQLLSEREAFHNQILQVVHDIRSPVAAIEMLTKHLNHLPEEERVLLRNATSRIHDIANQMLTKYRKNKASPSQASLLSAQLLNLLSEKRSQFINMRIRLEAHISRQGYFAFCQAKENELNRVISNLINNAAEAMQQEGLIKITLDANSNHLILSIHDHGPGIPQYLFEKLGQQGVTDKDGGSGLGIYHAKTTVQELGGNLQIESNQAGTTVRISLPQATRPAWFIEKLVFAPKQTIYILDDDAAIHSAWDQRLKTIIKPEDEIRIFHFNRTNDAIKQIQHDQTTGVFKSTLLTDYELIGSEQTGLDLVQALDNIEIIMVTSYFEQPEIQNIITQKQAKLLPKNLASEITIMVDR